MSWRRRTAQRSPSPGSRCGERWTPRVWRTGQRTDRDHARRLNEEELKRLTKEQLVTLARDEELPNRSKMNKAQLARTLRRHYRAAR